MQRHLVRGSGAAVLASCAAVVLVCVASAPSCSGRSVGSSAGAPGSSDESEGGYGGSFPALVGPVAPPTYDDNEAGATAADRDAENAPGEASDDGDASRSNPASGVDAGPDGACTSALSRGDLTIDELMVESVAGSGDDGEWFEVTSALDCTVNLNRLHGECPRGSKVATFDVAGDRWLPPRGTFVVADSSDPAINHRLPGLIVVWLGHTGDVLRNQGSTLTLSLDGALVDTLTYPSLAPGVGISVAFPSGCDGGLRSDFTHWKRSTASWFPGFFGTPNAPNTDVECP
jgi:hypothetical protein